MRKFLWVILFCLTKTDFSNTFYKECYDIDYSMPDKPRSEIAKRRKSSNTYFHSRYQDLIDYHYKDSTSGLFKGIAGFAAVIIILLIISFISCIIFGLFLLGKFRKNEEKVSKRKVLIFLILIMFIFFVFLLILVVYIGIMQSDKEAAYCGISYFSNSMINGINKGEFKFLGTKKIEETYSMFLQEYDQVKTGNQIFKDIFDSGVQTASNRAYTSTVYFFDTFKRNTTVNSLGNLKKPFTIINMQPGINFQIEKEFHEMNTTGFHLTEAANYGLLMTDGSDYTDSLQKFTSQFQALNSTLYKIFNSLNDINESSFSMVLGAYVSLLIFLFISLVLISLTGYVYFVQTVKKQDIKLRKLPKPALFIASIMILGSFFCSLFLVIPNASISSACKVIGDMNQGNWDTLRNITPSLSSSVYNYLSSCLNIYDYTDQISVFTLTSTEQNQIEAVDRVINGISRYNVFMKKYSSPSPKSIDDYQQKLDRIKTGKIPDHEDVNQSINDLNDLLSCSGDTFQLSEDYCNVSNCNGLYENPIYVIPQCVNNVQRANIILDNFQNYFESEGELVDKLNDQLIQTEDSPEETYQQAHNLLSLQEDNVNTISLQIEKTLKQFSDLQVDFSIASDCNQLQSQLQEIEQKVCFEFNSRLYIVSIFSFLTNIFLLISIWILAWGFRGDYDIEDSMNIVSVNDSQLHEISNKLNDSMETNNQQMDDHFESQFENQDLNNLGFSAYVDDEKPPVFQLINSNYLLYLSHFVQLSFTINFIAQILKIFKIFFKLFLITQY